MSIDGDTDLLHKGICLHIESSTYTPPICMNDYNTCISYRDLKSEIFLSYSNGCIV